MFQFERAWTTFSKIWPTKISSLFSRDQLIIFEVTVIEKVFQNPIQFLVKCHLQPNNYDISNIMTQMKCHCQISLPVLLKHLVTNFVGFFLSFVVGIKWIQIKMIAGRWVKYSKIRILCTFVITAYVIVRWLDDQVQRSFWFLFFFVLLNRDIIIRWIKVASAVHWSLVLYTDDQLVGEPAAYVIKF